MAWQANVGSGSGRATDYRDLLTKLVAFATSQHVATVAVNAGGTGYTVGDILTLTHAGAYLDARFEVTSVSSGVITGLQIRSSGAFSNRLASAAVAAGGTGYAVGDILEFDGGTSREKGKVRVATLSGSAVATVTVFETGGAYSVAPSAGDTTTNLGPAAAAGSGCTLNPTMTGLIGTTGLSVTGGTGSSATVDITLAQTGWAAVRNTNELTFNSLTDEKEVVLVGDATGSTNKPYVGFSTGTQTSGINTRYFVAIHGLIAHNPALELEAQTSMKGNPTTAPANAPYLLCDENQLQEMDFWFSASDRKLAGVVNINSGAASTDDGQYMHFYAGYLNSFATENEDPYPMMVAASARTTNIDPSAASENVTGLGECVAPTAQSTGIWFWNTETAAWVSAINSQGLSTSSSQNTVIAPWARIQNIQNSLDPDKIVDYGPINFYTGIGSTGRTSPTLRLRPVPGSTPGQLPIPLTLLHRPGGTSLDATNDTVRGQLDGWFAIYNTDASGATIANFSEDYFELAGDRYWIFHTHVHNQLYHFVALKEAV